jgi:hemolysin activation/secretion protein
MRPFPLDIRACLLTALSIASSAATPGLAATVQANPVELRTQEFERRTREHLEREHRLRQLEREPPAPASPSAPSPVTDEPCWHTSGLSLAGNSLLDPARVRSLLQSHLTACMSATQINQLLAALTALYVDAGFIASRPYLRQAPEDGQPLDIVIEQGFVESIELADPSLPVSLRGAFPGMLGQPLQLRDLEQGLDQLNRLRSLDLTVQVLPGTEPGGSHLRLHPRSVASRLSSIARYNNRGADTTGRHTGVFNLAYDSPLGLNDFINLSASTSLAGSTRYSRSEGIYYSLPYGYWTLALTASQAHYRYGIELPSQTIRANGQVNQYGVGLNRLLWRDQRTVLNGNLRLSTKRSRSYIADTFLAIQSPSLTVAEASLNLLRISDGIWNGTLSYAQGLRGLGADRDSQHPSPGLPRAQFRKYRLDIDYTRQSQRVERLWSSQLTLQYSPDPLPGLEQLLVTDHYAVRGFRLSTLAAANGAVWRNTLSLPRPLAEQWHISPRLGVDLGWSQYVNGADIQRVGGASLGMALSRRDWQLDLDYQRALFGPALPAKARGFWLMELSLPLK